ncbi:MAG: helix-turn-helix domain-containing protein [Polyangiaceae bacterium]
MASDAFSDLVASVVTEAQRPLVGVLEALRTEVAETRRELQELRSTSPGEQQPQGELVYLSLAQVATRLGVSRRTARRWFDAGKLPHVRLPSGGVRVSVAALDELLASIHGDHTHGSH